MLRPALLAAVLTTAVTGCTPAPEIVTENPPHYVMVVQQLGMADADMTVRVQVDEAADERCRSYGRVAELPAHEAECAAKHMFLGTCLVMQYIYKCQPLSN